MTALWLTPAEAAARLGMQESTLRSHVSNHLIPSHRAGRFLRFTEQDLADYVASCARPALERTKARKRKAA